MFYLTKRDFLAGDVQTVGFSLTPARHDLMAFRTLLSSSPVLLSTPVQVDTSSLPIAPGSSHSALTGPPVVRNHREAVTEVEEDCDD